MYSISRCRTSSEGKKDATDAEVISNIHAVTEENDKKESPLPSTSASQSKETPLKKQSEKPPIASKPNVKPCAVVKPVASSGSTQSGDQIYSNEFSHRPVLLQDLAQHIARAKREDDPFQLEYSVRMTHILQDEISFPVSMYMY